MAKNQFDIGNNLNNILEYLIVCATIVLCVYACNS